MTPSCLPPPPCQALDGTTLATAEEREARLDGLRRPRRRLRLRRLGHRAAADREGLPRRRARGRRPVRRRGLRGHVVGPQEVPVPARGRLLRHPADRRAQGLPDPLGGGRGRRIAGLRQHALRAAAGLLRRPRLARHHRLAGRAGAVLRPGQADARRRDLPAAHARRRGDARGRRPDGRGGDVPADAGRGVLRRTGGDAVLRRAGPVLRRRGTRPEPVPPLRRVHDGLPPQRQEHAGEELPAPRREERRDRPAADHGHPGLAARRWRVRRARPAHQGQAPPAYGVPRAHRRPGRLRGVGARHAAAAAPDEGRGPPAPALRPARRARSHQLRVGPRVDREGRLGRLHAGRRDHVLLPPRRAHAHRAGAVRQGLQLHVPAADRAHRRRRRRPPVADLAAGDVDASASGCGSCTTSGTGPSAPSSPWSCRAATTRSPRSSSATAWAAGCSRRSRATESPTRPGSRPATRPRAGWPR